MLGLAHSLELCPADQAKRNKMSLNVSVKENQMTKGMNAVKAKVWTLSGHWQHSKHDPTKCSALIICSPKASSE